MTLSPLPDEIPLWEDITITDTRFLPRSTSSARENHRWAHARMHEFAVQESSDTFLHDYTDVAFFDVTTGVGPIPF